MKSKILLTLATAWIGVQAAKAQTYGTWQGQTIATPFEYNIATGTLGATYLADGTAKSSASTSPAAGYLAYPPSGTARVFTSANGGGGFTIDGSKLSFAVSNSNETLNKFALYGVEGTSAVTSIFFKLKIESSPNGGTAILGFGKLGKTVLSADDVFTNDKQLNVAVSTQEPGIFGAFRFQPGNSQTNTGARYLRTSDGTYRYSDAQYGNSYAAFQKTTDLNIEIYCNNTNVSRSYSRGVGEDYTLPARTYNVFANGTLLTVENQPGGSLISNIPSTELAVGEKIDAIFIAGNAAASNQLIISVSDIKFGWIPEEVLPVSITSFEGKKQLDNIALNWFTAQEKDNVYFEILRSVNGKDFQSIGTVKGSGTSTDLKTYSFTDYNPANGINYYKLKQVDVNGEAKEHDKVVSVNFDELSGEVLKGYISAEGKLIISYNANENSDAEITVQDVAGRSIAVLKSKVGLGTNQFSIDVKGNSQAIYIVKVSTKSNREVIKVLGN